MGLFLIARDALAVPTYGSDALRAAGEEHLRVGVASITTEALHRDGREVARGIVGFEGYDVLPHAVLYDDTVVALRCTRIDRSRGDGLAVAIGLPVECRDVFGHTFKRWVALALDVGLEVVYHLLVYLEPVGRIVLDVGVDWAEQTSLFEEGQEVHLSAVAHELHEADLVLARAWRAIVHRGGTPGLV